MSTLLNLLRASALSVPLLLTACGGDDNDDEVRALEDRVDSIESRLGTIESSNSSISDSLTAIETRLATLEGDSASTATELAEIAALLDAIEMRLSEQEAGDLVMFEVNISNLTNNQPLSPVAVILHDEQYRAWAVGYPASAGLESLAESGSPAMLMEGATSAFASAAADGILMPGMSTSVSVSASLSAEDFARGELSLTVVSMPVNTNDAFSGVSAWNVSDLRVGDYLKTIAPIYDAGTEANTETLATVPGPAAGGEGYNAARDDIADQVTRHPGLVTADDGYTASALDQSHRFDQGAMLVTVSRVEM